MAFEPDGPLYAHAQLDLGDLRILDANGAQVPWRPLPERAPAPAEQVRVLNSGRHAGRAVALLDLGPGRRVHDRVDLVVPDQGFVGRVTVRGSDDRRTYTSLGSSRIFDLNGAEGRARSTVVTFAPTDFRYLELSATGVERIAGATVSGRAQRPTLRSVAADVSIRSPSATRILVDLRYRNVPVDQLELSAATPRYDRPVEVEQRNPGQPWRPVVSGRIFRYYGRSSGPIGLAARARLLRITIVNGDDRPLRGIRVRALAQPRPLLVEGGHPRPLRLLYGGRRRGYPDYDYARLPSSALGLDRLRRGTLAPEEPNAEFRPAPDTRSIVKRHPVVVKAALALAAGVVGLGGFLALRRRT